MRTTARLGPIATVDPQRKHWEPGYRELSDPI
jgi:hypothetical protein